MKRTRTIIILTIITIIAIAAVICTAETNSVPAVPAAPADCVTVHNAQDALGALIHYLFPNISFSGACVIIFWLASHVRSRRPDGNSVFDKIIALLAGDTTSSPPAPPSKTVSEEIKAPAA